MLSSARACASFSLSTAPESSSTVLRVVELLDTAFRAASSIAIRKMVETEERIAGLDEFVNMSCTFSESDSYL